MLKKWEIPIVAHMICPIANSMENVQNQKDVVQMLQILMSILKDASGIFSLEAHSYSTSYQKYSLSNAIPKKNAAWTTSVREIPLSTTKNALLNMNVAFTHNLIRVLHGMTNSNYVVLEMLLTFQQTPLDLMMQQKTSHVVIGKRLILNLLIIAVMKDLQSMMMELVASNVLV